MKNPCAKDCPDRKAECHGSCPKWQEYEDYKRQEYARRYLLQQSRVPTDSVEKAVRKCMNHKARRGKG